jgi:hypothetical protein
MEGYKTGSDEQSRILIKTFVLRIFFLYDSSGRTGLALECVSREDPEEPLYS